MTEALIIGTKVGMTRVFGKDGESIPVTVLQVMPNRVLKREELSGNRALITASYGQEKPLSRMKKAVAGQYRKANAPGAQGMNSFQVPAASELKIDDTMAVSVFVEGDFVDVSGVSKGKGFQGVIKRHGFSMQPATHGTSLSHRAHGSTGQCQDPGKVFKGKKMAGQMGNTRVTTQNLRIVRADAEQHLLLIKGAIPGAPGALVEVSAATKKKKGGEE